MNAVRRQTNEGVFGWVKAWLYGTSRRPMARPTFRPGLESLERRDVPSATGLDPAQLQAGLNYLGQVVQQQTAILQHDVSVLMRDAQSGQTGRLGADMQRLQNDFRAESQALTTAFNAVLSGHIPSATPANASPHSKAAATVTHQSVKGSTASSTNSSSHWVVPSRTSTIQTEMNLWSDDVLLPNDPWDPFGPYDPREAQDPVFEAFP
jgi:hypothetical protein